MRRFLSIWLPLWPLESRLRDRNRQTARQARPEQIGSAEQEADISAFIPFALTQSGTRGIEITAANQAAEIAGITKGMTLTDARALASNLKTEGATPDLDRSRLWQLALWCLRYSPLVTARAPDDMFIDITGCAHLFGGEEVMMADLEKRLQQFGFTCRLGLADTMGAAWAASHYGAETKNLIPHGKHLDFISSLPIAALRLSLDVQSRLQQLGLRHVKQLLDIPTPPLTTRFGPIVAERLYQATGTDPEIFDPLSPPPEYSLSHPFLEPVLFLDGISHALNDLTDRLSHLLTERQKSARQLRLNLFRIDGHLEQIIVNTSRLCHEATHMLLLFRERLSQLGEKINPGFGYDLMTLDAFDVETRQDHQSSWHGQDRKNDEPLNRLLDRFGNRFGFDQIRYWESVDSHIPERSVRHAPAKVTQNMMQPRPRPPLRPLILLPHAAPITVLAEVPDGPPIRFQWKRRDYAIIAADGPERIAPEWWREAPQGSFQTRDYYRVEDKEGYRFWIYRDGLYERNNDHPRWFIHGFFS